MLLQALQVEMYLMLAIISSCFFAGNRRLRELRRVGKGVYRSGYATEHNQFWEEGKSNFVQLFAETLQ